jgi:outer membrane protein assembly factor BamB/Mg-chelatase subunit ChlD
MEEPSSSLVIDMLAHSPWPMFRRNVTHTGVSPYDTSANPGNEKWNFTTPTGGGIYSSPAIDYDGTIYIGCNDNRLYALTPYGTEKWYYTTGGVVQSSPAIGSDGMIFFGSADYKFYALTPNGTKLWDFTTGYKVMSSPAIHTDGTIYFTSMDKKLYALDYDGSLKWSYSTKSYSKSSPAIGPDGTIYFGSDDHNIYAIYRNGTLKWSFTTGDIVESSPTIGPDGTIYIGCDDYRVYAINPDGTIKWSFSTTADVNSSPAIGSDGTIYIGSDDHKLYAINPNGTKKWSFSTGNRIYSSSPSIGTDGTIYFGSTDNKVYALKPDGSKKWSFSTRGSVYSSPAINNDGTIYIGSQDSHLYAIGIPGQNQPPVANADPDKTVFEGDIVYFDSSGSYDPDGTIVNYDWNFGDGSPHSNMENPRHIFNYAGNYTVTLTVTDDEGARGSDTCTINVLIVIKPPVADAGLDQTVYENDVVYFDGSGSYATVGAIKSLKWDFNSNVDSDGDGNTTNDVDATGATPTHIYYNEGVYNVTLRVTAKVETHETLKVNQDVVFVMDSSGSMNWNDPDDLRIQAAKNYVDKLNPDDRAAVVDFDTEAWLIPDGWPIGDHLSTNYFKIKNNLDMVDSEGGTFISMGLNLSNEELRIYGDSDNVPIIILLTDAQNTNPDDDEICINESKIAQDRGIKIFTIGLSMVPNSTGEQLLITLANITGGKYFPAPNASYLEVIYEEISELVENVTVQEMSDYDNCEVTVLSAVQPPVANAGEGQTVDEGDTVLIDSSTSYSPTGLIDRYEWDFESDGTYDYQETPGNAPDGAFDGKTTHVYGDNGDYIVTLRVTDDKNTSDTDTCAITVNNVNPIILPFVDPTVDEGSPINITAEAWDPGSEDLTFTWEFDFGLMIINRYKNYELLPDPYPSPWGIFPFSAMDSVEHTYGDDGVYSIILTVKDDDGGSCVYPIDITVNNVAPSIIFSGPFTVDEAEPFDISAMATDSGSDDLTFTWAFQLGPTITNIFYNDGLAPDTYPSPNGTFPFLKSDIVGHTYGDNGVYTITLIVEDDDGGTNAITINFTVNNVVPTIQPFGPITVDEYSSFDMTAISSDLGSDDLIFTWEFELGPTITKTFYNDGAGPDPTLSPWGAYPFSSSNLVGHTYGDNGVYTVTLTVQDDDGGSTVYTTNVTVGNVAPTVEIIEAYMYADISLRVAGEKWHSVDMYLYEEGSEIWKAKVTRIPGDPDEQKATIANVKVDMTKSYTAIVDYLPNDPRVNGNVWGGNPVWIELTFQNGSMFRLHHTFNVRQSYWDSDHWNHIDPWEVDLNAELIGCPFEVKYHVTDPGSDDEILTFSYGTQTKNVTCLNDPPNPDPFPSPEINPVNFTVVTTLVYEGTGTIILFVEDDDGGTASAAFDLL